MIKKYKSYKKNSVECSWIYFGMHIIIAIVTDLETFLTLFKNTIFKTLGYKIEVNFIKII